MISRIELVDFRNHRNTTVNLHPAVTAVIGRNGQGKTSLVEAMSYLSTLSSFRGVPNEALIRDGSDTAYVRAVVLHEDGREILVECEINKAGRNRVLVNRQRLARTRDLLGVVRSTVFAPTDLQLVYEGPGTRRDHIDNALVAFSPLNDALCSEVDRIVRQRNVLLKQANGRLTDDIRMTLDVWDEKFAIAATKLGDARAELVANLLPFVQAAYGSLAGRETPISMVYDPEWRRTGLSAALRDARQEDLRRAVSTVGPHRDDVFLSINDMPARSHASQGECRTLALAIRLGIHQLMTDQFGTAPLLVLDDVLSELDPGRSEALLGSLPSGQVLITAASPLPPSAHCDAVLTVEAGVISACESVDDQHG